MIVEVDITMTDLQTVEEFEAAVTAFDEVVEARRLFGRPDYYLRVLVADHTQYEIFSMGKLTRLPAISRIVSHQTMRLLKE